MSSAHSGIGASSARRWMNCPGSVRLIKNAGLVGQEEPSSEYAEAGHHAHALAEHRLQCHITNVPGLDLACEREFLLHGRLKGEPTGLSIEQRHEMWQAVSMYVDVVLGNLGYADLLVEHRVSFSPVHRNFGYAAGKGIWHTQRQHSGALLPPMFATTDALAVYRSEDGSVTHLDVFDLKYGEGILVEVENNPQLMYYAVAACDTLQCLPEQVTLIVVQPRAEHPMGPVRTWTATRAELLDFQAKLITAALETTKPDAALVPGDWCRWCKAGPVCPSRFEMAKAVALRDFSEDVETVEKPPAPEALSTEVLVNVMRHGHLVENWIKAVRAHVFNLLKEGKEVPGYKLVAKNTHRRWVNEGEVTEWLTGEQGFTPEEVIRSSLKSPAQIEKLLKSKGTELPAGAWTKPYSITVAAVEDPRPAVTKMLEAHTDFSDVLDD